MGLGNAVQHTLTKRVKVQIYITSEMNEYDSVFILENFHVCWYNPSMLNWTPVFGGVICLVIFPGYQFTETFLLYFITNPVISHIPTFGALLFDFFIDESCCC